MNEMIQNPIPAQAGPPYGDGLYANEPPAGNGLNITDLFHIVEPKADDPGINSKVDSQYPNVAIITPDATNQFGGMWAKEKLDLTMPFSTEIYLHLGHQYGKSGSVADGMTFTLHNDPAGLNAIGGAGEGLGVYRGRKWTGTGQYTTVHGTYLRNSLVIEFDTYRNLRSEGAYVGDPGNAGTSHLALLIPRANDIYMEDHRNVYPFVPTQQWVKFQVDWIPNVSGGGTLGYTFDGQQISYTVNNIGSTFGSTKVYWGFTGATGQLTSVQAAAITRLPDQGVIVEKTVKNEAGEDINYGSAYPGDILNYTLKVTAQPLNDPVGPIIIEDVISEHAQFAGGNVRVTTKSGTSFNASYTFSANTMTANTNHYLTEDSDWLEITFQVKVNADASGKIVYNKAEVSAEGLTDSKYSNTTEVTILSNPEKIVSDSSAVGQGGSVVSVGDVITYDITYINNEDTAATVVITDRLPDGTDFLSATDDGIYDNTTHTVTWIITDVSGGDGGKVSIMVSVNENARAKIENFATVQVGDNDPRFTNIVENPVTPEKMVSDQSAAGKDGSAVKAGDIITYDITYANYGETNAAIVITDILPDGVDFLSATDGGIYDDLTHTVAFIITDVASGDGGIVSVVVTVNERAVVKIENYATVQVGDHNPRNTNIVKNPVTPENPKKKVSDNSEAGVGGDAVKMGDKITYDITYVNYEETAITVIITDILPTGVDFLSATDGGIYNAATHTVTWTLANVASGDGGTVSMVVAVNERAMVKIKNYATVQVGDNTPQTTNIVENPVNPKEPEKNVSDLSEAGVNGSAVKLGDKITYDITYVNYEKTAVTVIITDTLPDGADFLSATDGGIYNTTAHTVKWTLTNVASGTYGTVSVVVRVNERAVVKIENYAKVAVGGNDPRTTNIVENPVTPETPEKKVSDESAAGVNGSAVKAGDRITYDIIYRNYGETITTVIIRDRLPAGVDFLSATNGGIYDAAVHAVIWTLTDVSGGYSGTVSMVVRVNKKAVIKIGNYATVQVGYNAPRATNIVENPVIGTCNLKGKGLKCRKTITGRKIWVDNNNEDGTRPPSVDINLLQDGEVYKSVTLDSTGDGIYAFACLPIWKSSEKKYSYQIDEALVPDNYTKKIEDYNIINTLSETT